MDEGSAKAVRVAFERLYRADLAYRTEALVNWCPGCGTSVSDLEVVPTPETGTLWSVRYHLVDPATHAPDPEATITVATTRPETILGDTAVAVHPEDERYSGLIGRVARIPFVDRDVPIIADERVDRAFGTGAVKITPAHDRDDHETGLRHGLAAPTILADDATVANTGTVFDGMDRYDARREIVAQLEALGDLAGTRDHEMVIGRCQRSHDVIEPRLKTQWFIRTTPLAERALESTRSGRTRILPERFEKTWALADQHPRLERVAPAVVGPPDPGLVLPRRACDGHVRRGWARRLRGLRQSGRGAPPGPGHLRHLVQLGALAVLDPRLAR
jgi:valyl-tRNA synthetase